MLLLKALFEVPESGGLFWEMRTPRSLQEDNGGAWGQADSVDLTRGLWSLLGASPISPKFKEKEQPGWLDPSSKSPAGKVGAPVRPHPSQGLTYQAWLLPTGCLPSRLLSHGFPGLLTNCCVKLIN